MLDIDSVFGSTFLLIIKFGLIAFLFLYIIFAGIVVKQIQVMTKTVQLGFENFIRGIGILHFIIAVLVFIVSLMSL